MQPRGARDGVRDGRGSVRRRLGVSVAVAATLGLALGAAATLLSVRAAILGTPLPYDEGDRLALVWNRLPEAGYDRLPLSDVEWLDHERELRVAGLVDAAAAFVIDRATLLGVGPPRALSVVRAQPELLAMLAGDGPELRGGNVCFVSHRTWREVFDSDPQLEGRRIEVDGRGLRVLGVLPESAAFPPPITWQGRSTGDGLGADLFVALPIENDRARSDRRLMGLVRRTKTTRVGKLSRRLEESALALAETHPRDHPPGLSALAVPLREQSVELVRPTLRTLTLAVALVLLVACVNASLVLLARSVERRGDVAIRAALGARRRHLVKDVLAESLGLAASGGVVAWGVAATSCWALRRVSLPGLPGIARVELDAGLAVSFLLLVVVCGLATGCAPAWRVLRGELSGDLKASRSSMGGLRLRRLQSALVVCELALAVMLLAVSAALVKDFVGLLRQDAGFRTEGVSHLDLHVGETGGDVVLTRLLDEIGALPDVGLVAASTSPPLSDGLEASAYHVDFGSLIVSSGPELATVHRVTPNYFSVLDLPIEVGTLPRDGVGVSAGLARRIAGESGAIVGARLTLDDPRSPDAVWRTIEGVVSTLSSTPSAPSKDVAAVFLPLTASHPQDEMRSALAALPERISLLVAGGSTEPVAANRLREAVWRAAPSLAVEVEPLSARLESARRQPRLAAGLLTAFAVLASMLAAVGVHGVLAFQVARRDREMALRQALGATLHDVRQLILAQAIRWAVLGTGVGLLLSWLIGRLLRSLLPGFHFGFAHFGWLLLAAPLVVPLAWLAARLPARRAVAVDPVVGLRADG